MRDENCVTGEAGEDWGASSPMPGEGAWILVVMLPIGYEDFRELSFRDDTASRGRGEFFSGWWVRQR